MAEDPMSVTDERKAALLNALGYTNEKYLDGSRFDVLNDGEGVSELGAIDRLRWALVERSKYGQTWVTLHATPQDAADYHDGQEYVEDWGDYELFDLDTGDSYYPEIATTWHLREKV
jgi:hypothetical protein